MFRNSIRPSAFASVERIRAKSCSATIREMAGVAAVAIETPNKPIGRYISRNAKSSHDTAPVPSPVASTVFTNTLICVAAMPMVPGPIKQQHAMQAFIAEVEHRPVAKSFAAQRRPLNRDLTDAADERGDGDDGDRLHAELRRDRDQAPAT